MFMKNKNLIITVLMLIIVAAVAFFGGIKYQQTKQPTVFRQGQQGTRVGQGNRQGFRPVNGDIIASDDKSITVKMADNSSRIILLSAKTTINKAAEAGISDLKIGEKVAVFGQDNSDGSVTAQNIQINPINRQVSAK